MDEKELRGIIDRAARENATSLDLSFKRLTSVPPKIGDLTNLTALYLNDNQLTSVPAELGRLTNLTELDLENNQLTSVPPELAQLTNLTTLYLHYNRLTSVPAELGQLSNLTELDLDHNQLTCLPCELSQLTNLTVLYSHHNQLTSVPAELAHLTNLETLTLDGNKDLTSPPPEVVKQGTQAILAYLRGRAKKSEKQWISKLILVGEGGVGKTQLLRALQGREFQLESETTHGIGIEPLTLRHPEESGAKMLLNCWDFGGQEIYHATHQFFLTKRSLFVLVWDARQGWEAGKLYKWLDAIEARAPGSPVLLVAAKTDERDADLPLEDLRKKYPQMLDHYEVSNKTRQGIEKLKAKLARVAAALPLMGEEWPAAWLQAANAIRKRTEQYISPKQLYRVTSRYKVRKKDSDILAQWMHDLGDILYFRENEELNDLVILNAAWVNEKISRVLESKEVIGGEGILTRKHIDELWADVEDESIREHLLRLMEQFDLSYRTLEDREISLVVERLPLDAPDYRGRWDGIMGTEGCKEISMQFSLGSLQAGLPTWFIARSHRFTTHTHWRMGALFVDGKEKRHLALAEANEHDRYLRLTVRGPAPHNFFNVLRKGLEWTLERFPGLSVRRTLPCPSCRHKGKKVRHEFEHTDLLERCALEEPKLKIECPKCYESISVPDLLFGIDVIAEDTTISRLETLAPEVGAPSDRSVPKVFIGSTGIDLAKYREAAINACIDMEMLPIAMEHFEAMGVGATEGSKRKLDQAALYVGIFAHRYGYVEDGYESSITELEFDYAEKLGLDRLCFILDEGHPWSVRFVDKQNYSRLQAFKSRINKNLIRSKFTTVENFSYSLLRSLQYWKCGQQEKDGYVYSSKGQMLERIDKNLDKSLERQGIIITELSNLRELAQRQFLTVFNRLQGLAESHCPNIFAVLPKGEQSWSNNLFGQKMVLQLFCQEPGHWHPAIEGAKGGRYEIRRPGEFFKSMGPYILKLVKVIKYAAPVAGAAAGAYVGPIGAAIGAGYAEKLAGQIKLMEELSKKLAERDYSEAELLDKSRGAGIEIVEKSELGPLRKLLNKLDPKHEWGGLRKVLTPEGHYLWLCEDHAAEYKK